MSVSTDGCIAVSPLVARFVDTQREVIDVADSDFTNVSAAAQNRGR